MKVFKLILLIPVLFCNYIFAQVQISPALETAMQKAATSTDYIGIVVYLNNQVDIEALAQSFDAQKTSKEERGKVIVNELMTMANTTQVDLLRYLSEYSNNYPLQIQRIQSFWIRNAIYIETRPSLIPMLALRDDVSSIDLNYGKYRVSEPIDVREKAIKSTSAPEPGLIAINAPALWAMGYTGRNTILLSMDTGVWTDHPALAEAFMGNYLPLSQSWYGMRSPVPADNASSCHGTHTTGTVLGLDAATADTIGVAYNAFFMATDPVASSDADLLSPTDFLFVYQWVLNPDGNPETSDDIPDVINNSWGYDYTLAIQFGACELEEAHIYETIEAAGVCSPFSAGNEGPGSSTNGFPAMLAYNLVNSMSIGAVNGNMAAFPIADFSSRGPTTCITDEGPLQIKPEVVAPGYSVRSAFGHDSYDYLSGTSMACPHVSGALLLLREAFPEVSAYDLKYALYITASDLGDPGEDNTYGMGMIDVLAAYNYLAMSNTPVPPVTEEYNITCRLLMPDQQVFCPDEAVFVPQLEVKNNGSLTVSDLNIVAKYNGIVTFDAIPNLFLLPGATEVIDLPSINGIAGNNEIFVAALHIEDVREYNVYDNYTVAYFNVLGNYEGTYLQNFDTITNILINSDWYVSNADMQTTWDIKEWDSEDANLALNMDFYNYLPRAGQFDDLWSAQVQLPDTGNISLNFVYAYKKRMETLFKDSLIVLLSTDCGETFPYELWRKGGVDMATVSGNAGSNGFTPETTNDWDTVKINLNAYKDSDIVVCLRGRNDSGGSLYIDDFSILVESNSSVQNQQVNKPYIVVFPNPANEMLFIETSLKSANALLKVYDAYGKVVFENSVNTFRVVPMNVDFLRSGVYFITLTDGNYIVQQRFVK